MDFTQQFKTRGHSHSDQIPYIKPTTPLTYDKYGRPVLSKKQQIHIFDKFYSKGIIELESPVMLPQVKQPQLINLKPTTQKVTKIKNKQKTRNTLFNSFQGRLGGMPVLSDRTQVSPIRRDQSFFLSQPRSVFRYSPYLRV